MSCKFCLKQSRPKSELRVNSLESQRRRTYSTFQQYKTSSPVQLMEIFSIISNKDTHAVPSIIWAWHSSCGNLATGISQLLRHTLSHVDPIQMIARKGPSHVFLIPPDSQLLLSFPSLRPFISASYSLWEAFSNENIMMSVAWERHISLIMRPWHVAAR